MIRKETLPVPTVREVRDAARQTARGHPSGGRVLVEERIAKRTRKGPGGRRNKRRS